MYPDMRLRRTRSSEYMRKLVRETQIILDKLVMPVFVDETIDSPTPIKSMPDIFSYDLKSLKQYALSLVGKGVHNVLLFGIPSIKDEEGTQAYAEDAIVQKAIPILKNAGLLVITDLCMCEYTDHGHCGIIRDGDVDNDTTLEIYAKIAVSQAKAGSDMIAPSGMMDGQILSIRKALDRAGFKNTPIMAYSAKYASNLYGPFRDAAKSTPAYGNRRSYQMDSANSREAMREIDQDIQEGADIIMVKPSLFYLDIVKEASTTFNKPLAVYGVSGEYNMIKNAIMEGVFGPDIILEYATSVFRAGADIFITYFAVQLCEILGKPLNENLKLTSR